MKKRRLKKWVKILITIVMGVLMVVAYSSAIKSGAKAMNGGLDTIKCVCIWIFLFTVPFGINEMWGE